MRLLKFYDIHCNFNFRILAFNQSVMLYVNYQGTSEDVIIVVKWWGNALHLLPQLMESILGVLVVKIREFENKIQFHLGHICGQQCKLKMVMISRETLGNLILCHYELWDCFSKHVSENLGSLHLICELSWELGKVVVFVGVG